MHKHWLRIVTIVVAVIVVIVIALPFLINVNSYRPKIESEASDALGRPVTIGKLSLSVFSGTVEADNVAIADDPAFGKSPFVTAQALKIGVELFPLIFSKKINITEIVLEKPQITLLKAANGTWNYSTLGGSSGKKAAPPKSGQAAPSNLAVGKLDIKNGVLSVGRANSKTKPRVYDKVNCRTSPPPHSFHSSCLRTPPAEELWRSLARQARLTPLTLQRLLLRAR